MGNMDALQEEVCGIVGCGKSKRCDKQNHHRGKCNSQKEFHKFWESSSSHINLKRKAEVESDLESERARLREVGEFCQDMNLYF